MTETEKVYGYWKVKIGWRMEGDIYCEASCHVPRKWNSAWAPTDAIRLTAEWRSCPPEDSWCIVEVELEDGDEE